MKTCTICNILKDHNNFNKKTKYHDGYSPWCKECTSLKNKQDYERTKVKRIKKAKDYYENNKEKILIRRKNDLDIKNYNQKWRDNHKKEISQYNKDYKLKKSNKF